MADKKDMQFIKHMFQKHKIPAASIVVSLIALVLYFITSTFASGGPVYAPHETLDPAFAPGTAVVDIPTGWGLTGNSGTTPGTNFIGTSDAQDLILRENSTDKIRLKSSNGDVIISGAGTTGTGVANSNSIINHLGSDSDFVITNGTEEITAFDAHITSGFAGNVAVTVGNYDPLDAFDGAYLKIDTGAKTAVFANTDNDLKVGIGTTSPSQELEVVGGNIKATGGLIIETRTSDPVSPATGQIWLRTDI